MYNNADEARDNDDDLDDTPPPAEDSEGKPRTTPLLPIIKHRDAAGFPSEPGDVKPSAPPEGVEPDDELYATVQEKPIAKGRVKKREFSVPKTSTGSLILRFSTRVAIDRASKLADTISFHSTGMGRLQSAYQGAVG